MATTLSHAGLPNRIQQLFDRRQQHADALALIDQTLAGIGAALGGFGANGSEGKAVTTPTPAPAKRGRKRRRGSYVTTGDESVLAFIKLHKKPSTQEVKAHWASEGRRGTADNILSKLFREKKVKRQKLDGQRGSWYALA